MAIRSPIGCSAAFLFLTTFLLSGAPLILPGADGSDGIFAPTQNVVVDLRQATPGSADAPSPAPGNGIYDSERWAVVFKYDSVQIPKGVTVQFTNHPSVAPVVWLVKGSVTINGVIDLKSRVDAKGRSIPGPGGFKGNLLNESGYLSGAAFGPGGAGTAINPDSVSSTGNYQRGIRTYGNSQIVPLIGGSGGLNGQAGAGAILIACQGLFTLSGRVDASDGNSPNTFFSTVGTGGAIRVIAPEIAGDGLLDAGSRHFDSVGRIRVETLAGGGEIDLNPSSLIVRPDSPPVIWPLSTAPKARIIQIGEAAVSPDPSNSLARNTADVALEGAKLTRILVETENVSIDPNDHWEVKVRITHYYATQGALQIVKATPTKDAAGVTNRWEAYAVIGDGYSAVQALVAKSNP